MIYLVFKIQSKSHILTGVPGCPKFRTFWIIRILEWRASESIDYSAQCTGTRERSGSGFQCRTVLHVRIISAYKSLRHVRSFTSKTFTVVILLLYSYMYSPTKRKKEFGYVVVYSTRTHSQFATSLCVHYIHSVFTRSTHPFTHSPIHTLLLLHRTSTLLHQIIKIHHG